MNALPAQAIAQRKLPAPKSGKVLYVDKAFSDAHRRHSFLLGLRVYPSGKRSWVTRYRSGGRGSRWSFQTLAPLETMDNAAARVKAAKIYKGLLEGGDPTREAKRKTEKRITGGNDVAWLVDKWIEDFCLTNCKPKTISTYKQILDTHLLPRVGTIPIASISKRDMIDALTDIKEKNNAGMAERVRRYANTMFNWATSEDIIDVPPTYKLKARAPKTSRERVLNVEEIRKIWMACDVFRDGQTSYGSFIQMLFLTAQRRNEIALMQRDEIDLEKSCYTIPAWRNKSARTHEVPLSPRAIRIITQRLDHEYDHIFPGARADFSIYDHQRGFKTHKYITLDQPMDGWSKLKKHLDELSGVTDWTQHDIRRTVGTGLAELEVPRLTISRVLNHKEGGVTSIYDRHGYFKEKLAALELWGRRLDQILTPDGGENVVPLPTRAG